MPKRHEVPKKSALDLLTSMGAVIRAHRLRLGVTQEELAWRADIHRTYLADIERGGRNITMRSIANLARALEMSVGDLLQQSGAPGAEPAGRYSLVGEILLVEDNPADVALTLRAFKRAKFTNPVKVVTDGQAALDYLFRTGRYARREASLPLLILLDLNLPKISGLEVLRQIKGDQLTGEIPVVVLTVSPADEHILECNRLGAVNYIIKPVDFENFHRITPALDMQWALLRPGARPPAATAPPSGTGQPAPADKEQDAER